MKFVKLITILAVFFAFINSLKVNEDSKKSEITNLNNAKSLDSSKNNAKNIEETSKQTSLKEEKSTKVNENENNEMRKLKTTKKDKQTDQASNSSDNSSKSSSDNDIDQPQAIEHLTATYIDNTKKSNKEYKNEVSDKTKADIQIPKDPVATPEEQIPSLTMDIPNIYRKFGKKAAESVKAKNETMNPTDTSNTIDSELSQNIKANEYVTPKIESLGPKQPRYEFEPVRYVKEISPAGKAALELQNSGEYIIFNQALTISSY
jgi:hypothetical protein